MAGFLYTKPWRRHSRWMEMLVAHWILDAWMKSCMCENLQYWVWRYDVQQNVILSSSVWKALWWKGVQLLATQKANSEARSVGRKLCSVFDASSLGSGRTLVQRLTPPPPPSLCRPSGARAFLDWGRGLHAEIAQSALMVTWEWSPVVWRVSSWLSQVQLVFSSRSGFFPFLEAGSQNGGSFVTAVVWSCAANFSHLVGVSASVRQLTGHGLEYYP